jgi:hypothetical protein
LSRKYGNLNIPQPYGSPRPVTGILLLIYFIYHNREAGMDVDMMLKWILKNRLGVVDEIYLAQDMA